MKELKAGQEVWIKHTVLKRDDTVTVGKDENDAATKDIHTRYELELTSHLAGCHSEHTLIRFSDKDLVKFDREETIEAVV